MLLGALLAAVAFALFSGGAIEIPAETRMQSGIAVLGLLCVLGLCRGVLAPGRAPLAWSGVALLTAFGVWCALSISWSVAPDESWLTGLGLAGIAVAVALYAVGGKIVPGLHIGPIDLNPGDRFARLREPIDYWNALALICVMATPVCIWQAASRRASPSTRVGAVLALGVLILTAALTYSRGAAIAYAVVLAIMVGAGPRRLTRLGVGLGAVAATTPAMVLAFERHDLSSSGVSLAERADDGALLGIALVATLALLGLIVSELIRLEPRLRWGPRPARRAWAALGVLAAGLALLGVVAVALSERGLTGEISHQIDEFSEPQGRPGNTPERLISSNSSNRYIWWQEAAGAFDDRPLAGWGGGPFPPLHSLFRRYRAPTRSAHSLP